MSGWIILGIVAAAVVWGVVTYNGFVASRNRFKNAFAQIDVQLKRRYDLVPNLVNAVKGYLKHERDTLEAVIAARQQAMQAGRAVDGAPGNAGALAALESAESSLTGSLGRLFALVESYPDLKADQQVATLIEELTSTENRIAFARQAFNDQVNVYNTEVESFPASVIARLSGFDRAGHLEATTRAEERGPVTVAL